MRYWERKAEMAQEVTREQKQEAKSEKSYWSNSDRQPNNSSNNSKGKSKKNTSEPNRTDISDKLGKDSKLLPKEHQRRINNNICLLCRANSHKVADCPKSTWAQATTTTATSMTMTTPRCLMPRTPKLRVRLRRPSQKNRQQPPGL